jgi:hypothetical protein
MKRQIIFFFLAFNFTSYGQTKKETIDWLNTKFEASPIVMNDYEQYTWFLEIKQDGSFTIQEFNYSPKVLLPDTTNYRWKTIFTGNFKDLSPNSIRTETISGKVFFYASCSNGKCITQQDQGVDYKTFKNSDVTLGIASDANLEARCKKAFIHLITLCGGRKEAF